MTTSEQIERKYFSKLKSESDQAWFDTWSHEIEQSNGRHYDRITLETSLGKTMVYSTGDTASAHTLVIFPGARTSALFWDLDCGLDNLKCPLRIFLVETNGLPNLSDGHTPEIRSNGYGHWASEVLDRLKIEKAFVAGASFGGLVCMKLAITNPEKIQDAFLLNPGCLQPFSLSLKNLYFNILPIVSPTQKNVDKFLKKAVFCYPTHGLSAKAYQLLVDYEVFALTRYVDKTQKPYFMNEELRNVSTKTHLLVGTNDLLFPYQRSVNNAKKLFPQLESIKIFQNVGHGIETYKPALQYIGEMIRSSKP